MQTIYLDISNKGIIPTIYAKQKDVGRKFKAVITDYNGVPRDISPNEFFSVWYDGESGSGNYTTIGEESAFHIENNTVVVELINQMLLSAGDGILSLVLHGPDGERIGLWNISYYVEAIPGEDSEEANHYYDAFSEDIENARDMLNKSVMRDGSTPMTGDLDIGTHRVKNVADPEEDGDAVPLKYAEDHFAPTGYGLGGSCITVDNWDNATANGFYHSVWGGPINGYDFQGIVIRYAGGILIQKVWRTLADTIISAERRRDSDGTWQSWEWVNPPMIPGVEYRTTKRHNGNVVYDKCVNLGTLPNTGDAQAYLAAEVRRVLSLDLIAVRPDGKSYFFDELNIAWDLYWHTESDGLSLLITTRSDHSNRTGYAIMEFTRS